MLMNSLWGTALVVALAACSSKSTPSPATGAQDSGTNTDQDAGAVTTCTDPLVTLDSPNKDPGICAIVETCGSNAYKVNCDSANTPTCECNFNGTVLVDVPYPANVCANAAQGFAACHFPSGSAPSGDGCTEPLLTPDFLKNDPRTCTIIKTCGSNAYKANCDPYNTPTCQCISNGKVLVEVPYPDNACTDPGAAFAACHFQ